MRRQVARDMPRDLFQELNDAPEKSQNPPLELSFELAESGTLNLRTSNVERRTSNIELQRNDDLDDN